MFCIFINFPEISKNLSEELLREKHLEKYRLSMLSTQCVKLICTSCWPFPQSKKFFHSTVKFLSVLQAPATSL